MPPFMRALVGLAALVGVTTIIAGDFLTFVRIPSLVIVLGITVLTQFVSFGPKNSLRAFFRAPQADATAQELAQRLRVFQGARIQCLGAGLLSGVLTALIGLSRLDSMASLLPLFGSSLVCVFYALSLRVFVLIPLEQRAIQDLDRNLLPAGNAAAQSL